MDCINNIIPDKKEVLLLCGLSDSGNGVLLVLSRAALPPPPARIRTVMNYCGCPSRHFKNTHTISMSHGSQANNLDFYLTLLGGCKEFAFLWISVLRRNGVRRNVCSGKVPIKMHILIFKNCFIVGKCPCEMGVLGEMLSKILSDFQEDYFCTQNSQTDVDMQHIGFKQWWLVNKRTNGVESRESKCRGRQNQWQTGPSSSFLSYTKGNTETEEE